MSEIVTRVDVNKINAIKRLREEFGFGLLTAKEIVEEVLNAGVTVTYVEPIPAVNHGAFYPYRTRAGSDAPKVRDTTVRFTSYVKPISIERG